MKSYFEYESAFLQFSSGLANIQTVLNCISKHFYFEQPFVGRAGHFGVDGKESVFLSAVLPAVKSCNEIRENSEKFSLSDTFLSEGKKLKKITFVTSLVILEGQLFNVYLDKDDELKVEEVSYIPFVQHYISPNYKNTKYFVEVVTLNNLESYLLRIEEWHEKAVSHIKEFDGK